LIAERREGQTERLPGCIGVAARAPTGTFMIN